MPPRHNFWCAVCEKRMFRSKNSLPQGVATCQDCRRTSPMTRSRRRTCVDCGALTSGKRCRPCDGRAKTIRPADDVRVLRRQRERAAPGLTANARSALLAHWIKQSQCCAYCPELATTIDHVVPLVRGGTNREGNLIPACRRCNGSKGGRFISEWRHGRKPTRMTAA